MKKDKAQINIKNDNFSDLKKHSENSLKEVWDNKKDDIWNEYLKNEG